MLDCWPGYRGMVGSGHKLFLLIADVPFWILGIVYIAELGDVRGTDFVHWPD